MMRIGYLGAGNMLELIAPTISQMEGAQNYAVASRDVGRAKAAAEKHGFERAYGSYEELVQDPNVDLVYIATTISHHYQQAMLSLKHGKPVLCEKSFMASADETRKILAAFKEKNLLIAEAMWPRYSPFSKTIRQLIDDGIVGEPRMLTASLGYPVSHIERLKAPELAGGALLDIGVYTLNFAAMMFGSDVSKITSAAFVTKTGVDEHSSISLQYEDGKLAVLSNSMSVRTDKRGTICGSKGTLVVNNVNNPTSASLYGLDDTLLHEYHAPPYITGYEYQVEATANALAQGLTECPDMPHSEILRIMECMDNLRTEWGVSTGR